MNPFLLRLFLTLITFLNFFAVSARELTAFRKIPAQYELRSLKFNKDVAFLVDGIEDNEGFVWFSANKGIYAYDGSKIVNYANNSLEYPFKKNGATGGSFGIIRKDTAGLLYIQERDHYSFVCFDPVNRNIRYQWDTTADQSKGLKFLMSISTGNDILGVFLDRLQKQYFIRRLDNKKATKRVYTGPYNDEHTVTFQFGKGHHWLCHNKQIIRIAPDGSSLSVYELPGINETLLATYADKQQVFFLNRDCTRIYTWEQHTDKIVLYLDLSTLRLAQTQVLNPFWRLNVRFAVKDGLLYLGSEHFFFIINKKEQTIQDLSGIYDDDKTISDSMGKILQKILCTESGHIFLVKGSSVQQLQKKADTGNPYLVPSRSGTGGALPAYSFRAITADEQGNIYASYYYGLMYKKNKDAAFRSLSVPAVLQPKLLSTYSLNYWKGHLLWNNLLLNISNNTCQFLDDWQKIEHTTQCLDKDTLWYYTWRSARLHRYDLNRKKLDTYHIDSRLSSWGEPLEEINDMIPDHTGRNLWLATKWHGIALITKEGKLLKKFGAKELNIREGLGATVHKLHLDGEQLWYGCADGLGLLNTRTGENIVYYNPYHKDGNLYNRDVFALVADSLDNFYLGTSMGIAYFDTYNRKFYNLPQDHPLAQPEFNRNSAFKGPDNKYYFGSINGLYAFAPGTLSFNSDSAKRLKPIKMFNITVFNSKTKKNKFFGVWQESLHELILGPDENTISMHFSAPDLEKTVYYSYRILEQSEDWSDYSLNNKIYLSSLSSGTYSLEIKASTELNDDAARFYKIKIVVKPVWHKLLWVRILMLLSTIVMVTMIMRWRYRQKLRKQQEMAHLRMKISMDLHDDVGSILSGLAVQSELLSYTMTDDNKQTLTDISNMSRDAMETMRDIVWAMDNRKDKYENLLDRMMAFAAKNLAGRNIDHEFLHEGIPSGQYVEPEKRQAIYLIFKEALTNVVRHSDATRVVISLSLNKHNLCMEIRDNGSTPFQVTSAGAGVDNMRLRAEKIGAAFNTMWEQGYIIRLTVPVS